MGLYAAFLFLTRIPLPYFELDQKHIARSLPFFPFVGAVIGVLLAGVDLILKKAVPAPALAALLVTLEMIVTGGLHVDGFADTMDGLFCGKEREKKLEVMKDSRLGAYGAIGVVLLLLLKYSAMLSILPEFRTRLLIIFPVISRWMMTYSITFFPYLREKGIGRVFNEDKSSMMFFLSTLFTLTIVFIAAGIEGIKIAFLTFVSGLLFSLYIFRQLGGMTGDTYGAVNEFCEIAALYIYLIYFGRL
ncbi:adenosylcobinamide-GDP ribazoletransferase [Thermosediminibacter oceani]|uniref:Adenosylcobinamide-GDP ribazoletransferase n=1 Tax=Thermosediminibacter oceani (strain ATCC BAA-1034 / DSM 16646 / JW/IW-1228P) TaxID=555079 RepID=D9RXU9_THEOJ|nr:adenosylcobinamide-GDP ribazoletransferase [Thermosediminibacter oceani]ADL08173.1 cobalamin 5'-phosphate synthase [Thermosediminibacter oceani DSM 16646]